MAYTAIDDPEAYFRIKLYTGDGSQQAITFDTTDTSMQPDFLWFKSRNQAQPHGLYDSIRGVNKSLRSNDSSVEETSTSMSAINSNGFTVENNGKTGENANNYVAWCWKESATAGFDIVTYTGNETNRTISHSLSAVPNIVLVKNRGSVTEWQMYHPSLGNTKYLQLDTNFAAETNSNRWQDTTPTSSVFSIGTHDNVNKNGDGIVAYLWSEKQGFSKFGSYTGNGNADGAFVYTGFRPAFVMTKSADSSSSWHMFDNKREGYNVDNDPLVADATTVEATTDMIDLLSNGFKIRISTDPNVAETYIYAAFAEAPFVNSNGVPCNAR